ncbi:MAG: FIST C-terminal domain-containing protein [Clostridiales bacterium]|jgi:hypothetical protein|nr:FIST C-terminal domain-containing protein [Clostridiales bacterium]
MLKFYTAFTQEIDDADAAVEELLEQLRPAENMRKNTIGVVHFYHEFTEEDVWKTISDALPFELIGCVSSYTGSCGMYNDIAMSVAMITSDDVNFSVKTIEGIAAKSSEQVEEEIKKVCADFCASEKPKMIIPIIPPMPHFSGDDLISTINALPEFIPFFGTVAFSMENSAPNFVLGGGKISEDMHAYLAFYGETDPKFHVTTSFDFDEDYGVASKITDAEKAVLKTVDGIPAVEYLKKIGMVTDEKAITDSSVWAVPAILTYPDKTKVVRAFLGIVEGTDDIFATGAMKAGANIKFAYLDGNKTLASAEKLIKGLSDNNENDILAYSCAARAWSLGAKFYAEAEKVAKCADDYEQKNGVPLKYSIAYSGGEICPLKNADGKLINTLHNYTLITCSFN